jgi:hypothetical protein
MNAREVSGALPPRLDPAAVYRTPTGRLCVVRDVQYHEPVLRNGAAVAHIEYLRPDGRPVGGSSPDGFNLNRDNWPMLKLVGQRDAAAGGAA